MGNKCLKDYLKYMLLNVMGMLGLSCYILADTFFVAKGLGSNGLAALNLAIPVYSFIHGTGLMLGIGGAARYTMLRSQGMKEKANTVFRHTVTLVICFGILFFVPGLLGAGWITGLLGADAAVFEMCRTYLRVLLLFAPMFLLNDMLICFVRNDGAPQLAMMAMLGGSFSNIILDYIFIFPLKLGIFGAVFATGLAPVISVGMLSLFFLKKKNHFHMGKFKPSAGIFRYIFTGGLSSLVAEMSSGIVIIVFNMIILGLKGNIGVAAYGVTANLSLVVLAIYTGIAQGIQPLVSKSYGEGKKADIRTYLRYAVITVVILSAVIYAGVYFGGDGIAAVFNSEGNENLQRIAVRGMKIYFTGCVFAGINIVTAICFMATDRAVSANIISILRGFIFIIPLSFLLSAFFGMTGLWLAFPVTEMLVVLAGAFSAVFRGK